VPREKNAHAIVYSVFTSKQAPNAAAGVAALLRRILEIPISSKSAMSNEMAAP
jgi:hypothetical protein